MIAAPAERVWELVAHRFDRIGDWATAIAASRPIPHGRVCATGMRMFPEVTETIVAYDDEHRTLTYVGEGMPAFVNDARNRWHVVPIDDQRARVKVEATLETHGLFGRLLRLPLRLYLSCEGKKMLADLKHYVEQGEPSARKQRQLRG